MMTTKEIEDCMTLAKNFAKAERELKIEHWVTISFYITNEDPRRIVHMIDIPRSMLERWEWLVRWREARLICQYPKSDIRKFYCFYDKRTGLETGFNTLLSRLAATKAQVTRVKRIIEQYIIHETQNNLFFDPETDERLIKVRKKLEQKYKNVEKMEIQVIQEVINNQKKKQAA